MSLSTLTPEWDDDERMDFMFSAFKENRDVNTKDWDSKVDFWTVLVLKSCRQRGTVRVSLQELNQTFRRKDKSPLGLPTVLRAMSRCGKIQSESEFAANVDCGWMSWGFGLLLVKPLKWTVSALLGGGSVPLQEPFVLIELVKEKAAAVLGAYRRHHGAGASVLSLAELRAICSDVCADESTLCTALLQLQRDKQVTVSLHDGEKIVKFCEPGRDRVSPLTELDVGIYQLRRSEALLAARLDQLGLEAEKCRQEAKTLLRDGKKSQALSSLRGRRRLEKRTDNLFAKLESIRGILDRVTQSQADKMVIEAYQAGVAALRFSLKDATVKRAENLMDQIQELCDTQDEVNQTISSMAGADEDMDELEEELKSLLDESKPDSIPGLPDVPTSGLRPPGGTELLGSPPAVSRGALDSSAEQLEEELSWLTLADSGSQQQKTPTRRLEAAAE